MPYGCNWINCCDALIAILTPYCSRCIWKFRFGCSVKFVCYIFISLQCRGLQTAGSNPAYSREALANNLFYIGESNVNISLPFLSFDGVCFSFDPFVQFVNQQTYSIII